jgi:isopentenyl diphosphate isomerase/L-lactate dehydrogenase-like FMN-dependent dehydrogenase
MKSENPIISSESQPDGLLPWHKPWIERLAVSLDTAGAPGSGDDFEDGSEFLSDVRVKKDISGIKDALSGILALKGVTYRYDTSKYPEMGLSSGPQVGFIAQELEQVYPELVTTKASGFKAVNYAQLAPVLAEAIKEQQSMIADLQEQVNALQRTSAVGAP